MFLYADNEENESISRDFLGANMQLQSRRGRLRFEVTLTSTPDSSVCQGNRSPANCVTVLHTRNPYPVRYINFDGKLRDNSAQHRSRVDVCTVLVPFPRVSLSSSCASLSRKCAFKTSSHMPYYFILPLAVGCTPITVWVILQN